MSVGEAAKITSSAVERHGLPVVLTVILLLALGYFGWNQNAHLQRQDESWRQIQVTDMQELRKELQTEREFNRGKLVDTIENNSEAMRDLASEIKRTKI